MKKVILTMFIVTLLVFNISCTQIEEDGNMPEYQHYFQSGKVIDNINKRFPIAYIFKNDGFAFYTECVTTNSSEEPPNPSPLIKDVIYLGIGKFSHMDGSGVNLDEQLKKMRQEASE